MTEEERKGERREEGRGEERAGARGLVGGGGEGPRGHHCPQVTGEQLAQRL